MDPPKSPNGAKITAMQKQVSKNSQIWKNTVHLLYVHKVKNQDFADFNNFLKEILKEIIKEIQA